MNWILSFFSYTLSQIDRTQVFVFKDSTSSLEPFELHQLVQFDFNGQLNIPNRWIGTAEDGQYHETIDGDGVNPWVLDQGGIIGKKGSCYKFP